MKTIAAMLGLLTSSLLIGCTPEIEAATSKEPITINMDVKTKRGTHIKVNKGVESLLKSRSDLF